MAVVIRMQAASIEMRTKAPFGRLVTPPVAPPKARRTRDSNKHVLNIAVITQHGPGR